MLLQIPTANLNPNELSFSPSFLTAPIIFSVPDRHPLVRTSLKVKVWCCPVNLDNWLSVNNCLLWPSCGIIAGEGSWNEKAVEGNSLSTVQAQTDSSAEGQAPPASTCLSAGKNENTP